MQVNPQFTSLLTSLNFLASGLCFDFSGDQEKKGGGGQKRYGIFKIISLHLIPKLVKFICHPRDSI